MPSNSWVVVNHQGEEIEAQRTVASPGPDKDDDLDAPLSDLVEKQRRMSRSSQRALPDKEPNDPPTPGSTRRILFVTLVVGVTLVLLWF